MTKKEIIKRLGALLSVMGVLVGGPMAMADDTQTATTADRADSQADAAAAAKWGPPYPQPLYGVTLDPLLLKGNLSQANKIIGEAESVLRWANTPAGKAKLAKDARLRGIVADIRANISTTKRKLAEAREAKKK